MTDPTKPGLQTSEFKVFIIASLATSLVAFGLVSQADAEVLAHLLEMAITGVSAIFVIGWLAVEYIHGRRDLHALMIEKGIIPQDQISVEVPMAPVLPESETPAPDAV